MSFKMTVAKTNSDAERKRGVPLLNGKFPWLGFLNPPLTRNMFSLLLTDLKVKSFHREDEFDEVWSRIDQIWSDISDGRERGVAIWWWVLWQHGCCLLGQRMTRTKVRRDPAEKIFREGAVDKLCNFVCGLCQQSLCVHVHNLYSVLTFCCSFKWQPFPHPHN